MVSSLLHVLIVTPVIFYWIQLHRLNREGQDKDDLVSEE
jgi:hypothetical protein